MPDGYKVNDQLFPVRFREKLVESFVNQNVSIKNSVSGVKDSPARLMEPESPVAAL